MFFLWPLDGAVLGFTIIQNKPFQLMYWHDIDDKWDLHKVNLKIKKIKSSKDREGLALLAHLYQPPLCMHVCCVHVCAENYDWNGRIV